MSRRSRHSKGKKIWLIIFSIVAIVALIVLGISAKLYFDLSGSIKETYESVERQQQSEKNRRTAVLSITSCLRMW